MKIQEMIAKIDQARRLVREIRNATDVPQIERCMAIADMNLHWAKWNLGEVDEVMPELEGPPSPERRNMVGKPR